MSEILYLFGYMLLGGMIYYFGYRNGMKDGAEDYKIAAVEALNEKQRLSRFHSALSSRLAQTLRDADRHVPADDPMKRKISNVLSEWEEHYF